MRSSATDEDSATAAFAGQYETYLNIVGADAVFGRRRAVLAVVQVLLVREIVTLLSVGNVMWPIQHYRRLLLAQTDEEQEEMTR